MKIKGKRKSAQESREWNTNQEPLAKRSSLSQTTIHHLNTALDIHRMQVLAPNSTTNTEQKRKHEYYKASATSPSRSLSLCAYILQATQANVEIRDFTRTALRCSCASALEQTSDFKDETNRMSLPQLQPPHRSAENTLAPVHTTCVVSTLFVFNATGSTYRHRP